MGPGVGVQSPSSNFMGGLPGPRPYSRNNHNMSVNSHNHGSSYGSFFENSKMTSPTVLNSNNFLQYSNKGNPLKNKMMRTATGGDKNTTKTSNGDYPNINSAGSTNNHANGFQGQNSSTGYSSSHRGNLTDKNPNETMVKVKSEVFNNVYKVRHLLDEIGCFMGDLNSEGLGMDLSGYLESMRTCQVIVDD
jgi:hypothetical protein